MHESRERTAKSRKDKILRDFTCLIDGIGRVCDPETPSLSAQRSSLRSANPSSYRARGRCTVVSRQDVMWSHPTERFCGLALERQVSEAWTDMSIAGFFQGAGAIAWQCERRLGSEVAIRRCLARIMGTPKSAIIRKWSERQQPLEHLHVQGSSQSINQRLLNGEHVVVNR